MNNDELKNNYYVSFCIPTNGILEWVIPVLDSIYNQGYKRNASEVCESSHDVNI